MGRKKGCKRGKIVVVGIRRMVVGRIRKGDKTKKEEGIMIRREVMNLKVS
jgi:hypothetical protein